jgi:hypothetical protein
MPMLVPPDHTPRHPRARIRVDARLDAATRQKVDDLAGHFRRPRAAVLHHIMRWGLECGVMAAGAQGHTQGPVRHLYVYLDGDPYEAVQKAATTAGVKIAPWLRGMAWHIPLTDFPTSWEAARSEARSHDSRRYHTRVMLRLDASSHRTLQDFVERFAVPKATIIRQLIVQATPEDFPPSWQMRAAERRAGETRPARRR